MKFARFGKTIPAVLTLLAAAAGCSTPELPPPPPRPLTAEMMRRGAEFRAVLSPAPRRWVAVGERAVDAFHTHGQALTERIRSLGFEEAVIRIDDDRAFDRSSRFPEKLESLIRVLTERRMPYRLMFRQGDFYRFDAFQSPFSTRPAPWVAAASRAADFIDSLSSDCARPAGLVLVPEPHRFTPITEKKPGTLLYVWQDKCFGPGLDNDELLKQSLRETAEIARRFPGVPVTVGLAGFYHDDTAAGKLTAGRVEELLKFGDPAMVSLTGAKPSEQVGSVLAEFAALAGHPRSLMVEVRFAEHTYANGQSFRRRSWEDLIRILQYGMERWRGNPAFGGVLFNSFEALDTIQEP